MKNKPLIFIIIGIIILAAAFIALKPKAPSPTQAVAVPQNKVFELSVKDRKLTSGESTLSVHEGDMVVIKITVDEDEELHLHGYDKSIDLEKDQPGELSFAATLSGRFEFELEDSKTELGVLEVLPQQ